MQTWFAVGVLMCSSNRSSCIKMFFALVYVCIVWPRILCCVRVSQSWTVCSWQESGYVMFSAGLCWWHTYVLGRWAGAGHYNSFPTSQQHPVAGLESRATAATTLATHFRRPVLLFAALLKGSTCLHVCKNEVAIKTFYWCYLTGFMILQCSKQNAVSFIWCC